MLNETEFLLETGISREKFQDILALGWVETHIEGENLAVFSDNDVYRVRKLVRICTDFELPVIGGTIIVDLLERISELEATVRMLEDKRKTEI